MSSILPRYLYRGDSDPNKVRRLKESWGSHGYLFTNMANGGNPFEIFNAPLIESIQRHVDIGWERTHFLSFSECYKVARRFAAGRDEHEMYPSMNNRWDAAIFTFDINQLSDLQVLGSGIFAATYPGRSPIGDTGDLGSKIMRYCANREHEGQPVSILLVDVVSQIKACIAEFPDLHSALQKAQSDLEWLVLPKDPPIGDAPNSGGFTACLDDGCIAKCDKFIFNGTSGYRTS